MGVEQVARGLAAAEQQQPQAMEEDEDVGEEEEEEEEGEGEEEGETPPAGPSLHPAAATAAAAVCSQMQFGVAADECERLERLGHELAATQRSLLVAEGKGPGTDLAPFRLRCVWLAAWPAVLLL